MKRHRLSIILTVLPVCIASAQTAEQKADTLLSLEECICMAIENSSQTNVAKMTSRQAQYTMRSIRSNFFPKFSAMAGYLYSDSKLEYSAEGGYLPTFTYDPTTGTQIPNLALNPTTGLPMFSADGNFLFSQSAYFPGLTLGLEVGSVYGAGALVKQPIFMGGKIVSGYKMAKRGTELAEMNVDIQSREISYSVEEAYWNCLKAKQMTSVLQDYVQTLESFRQDVANGVELGLLSTTDKLEVDSKCAQASLDLRKARNMCNLATMNLCRLIGLPLTTSIDLSNPVNPSANAEVLMSGQEFNVTERTEYQMLETQIEMQRQQVNVTRADFLPQIAAVGSYSYMNGLRLNDSKLFDNSGQAGVMVTGSIPLFQWGEGANKVRAEKAKLAIMEMERNEAVSKMQLQATQSLNALEESYFECQNAELILSYARENMKVVNDRYELGGATVSEKLKAQTELQKAEVECISAMCNLNLAVTTYKKAMALEKQK